MTTTRPTAPTAVKGLAAIVGFLVMVEVASGILQGYYTPIYPQIAEHLSISEGDVNWFEAAQLIVSALCIPLLARLGDLVGHKRVLLISTAVTALGSWWLAFAPGFTTFLIGWAIQGAYVVWLPLEIAIIHRRTRDSGRQELLTRRGAAILVGFLELAVIIGAVTSGLLVDSLDMNVLLAMPAVVVTAVFFVILVGIEQTPGDDTGGIDWTGLGLITVALGILMGGLVWLRLDGAGSPWGWLTIAVSFVAFAYFWRFEQQHPEPIVDVRLLSSPAQWPVQVTAFLFGIPVLGGQIPLSTYAQADPAVRGYGLGADSAFISTLIGLYVITLAIGAFTLPLTTRLLGGVRRALVVACLLVGIGYLLWLPFHDETWQALINMAIAGLGSGALVAALPAAAAAAAPPERTGIATGMTNGTKTVGGAIASAIFAIALTATGSLDATAEKVAPLSGYLTVWAVCAGASFLAALALMAAPEARVQRRPDGAGRRLRQATGRHPDGATAGALWMTSQVSTGRVRRVRGGDDAVVGRHQQPEHGVDQELAAGDRDERHEEEQPRDPRGEAEAPSHAGADAADDGTIGGADKPLAGQGGADLFHGSSLRDVGAGHHREHPRSDPEHHPDGRPSLERHCRPT